MVSIIQKPYIVVIMHYFIPIKITHSHHSEYPFRNPVKNILCSQLNRRYANTLIKKLHDMYHEQYTVLTQIGQLM